MTPVGQDQHVPEFTGNIIPHDNVTPYFLIFVPVNLQGNAFGIFLFQFIQVNIPFGIIFKIQLCQWCGGRNALFWRLTGASAVQILFV